MGSIDVDLQLPAMQILHHKSPFTLSACQLNTTTNRLVQKMDFFFTPIVSLLFHQTRLAASFMLPILGGAQSQRAARAIKSEH